MHFQAAVALYPICWLYNHVPGADFADLVDAPIRIMVGSADDYDGGGDGAYHLLTARPDIDASRIGILGESMGGIETLLMMTRHNSDAILGPGGNIGNPRVMSSRFRPAASRDPPATFLNRSPGMRCFFCPSCSPI